MKRRRAKKRRPGRARSLRARLVRYALIGTGVLVLLAIALFAAAYAFVRIPAPSDIATAQSTIVLDRGGRVIARLHAEADRVDIPFEQMPRFLRQAVIAAEDRDFERHRGVSIPSIVRAAAANLLSLGVKQGGSTITQQYVKNAYVGRERTLWRKMKEAIVAIKIERQRSKDEILEAYLNTIYFGRGAYGVEAAARTYFGVAARSLELGQAALLAGIIRAPEAYDPVRAPERAVARRNAVLDAMAGLGFVSDAEAARAKATEIKVRRRASGTVTAAAGAHFVEDVRRQLVSRFGAARVYRGGLRVQTTLDLRMQGYAEEAARTVLGRDDDPEAAVVAIDPDTGAVRAMVGGRDFERRQFNLASQGRRQPGSAFKPFVLAAALEKGLSARSLLVAPARITLKTGFQPWTVENYDSRDYGTIDLVEATAFSVNTVYAQLILKVGPKRAAEVAGRAGIASKLSAVPSLALGTSPVTPLELTGAYATFATGGMRAAPYLIERVTDAKGKVLFKATVEPERVLPETVASTVTYAMRQAVERGTGRRAALAGRPVAGKTGTTEDHVDAWFAGATRRLVATVWMGFPEGGRTMERVRGIAVTGGSFPARIWKAFMERALEGSPVEGFGRPSFGGEVLNPSPTPTQTPTPTPTPTPTGPALPSLPPGQQKKGSPSPTPGQASPTPGPTAAPAAPPGGGGGG